MEAQGFFSSSEFSNNIALLRKFGAAIAVHTRPIFTQLRKALAAFDPILAYGNGWIGQDELLSLSSSLSPSCNELRVKNLAEKALLLRSSALAKLQQASNVKGASQYEHTPEDMGDRAQAHLACAILSIRIAQEGLHSIEDVQRYGMLLELIQRGKATTKLVQATLPTDLQEVHALLCSNLLRV